MNIFSQDHRSGRYACWLAVFLSLPAAQAESASAVVSPLYAFQEADLTAAPARLVVGNNGRLYGTASFDGGVGFFSIENDGSNYAIEKVDELANSRSVNWGPVADSLGNFIAGAWPHPTSCPQLDVVSGITTYSTVVKLDGAGQSTVLSLPGRDDFCPLTTTVIDTDDNIYFLSSATDGTGLIHRLIRGGTEIELIKQFNEATDGRSPVSIISGSDGWLYGVTNFGGPGRDDVASDGTIFKLRTDGSDFTVLHAFVRATDGRPSSGENNRSFLVEHGDWLYGSAAFNGPSNAGTVYRIRKDGTDFRVLHSFDFATRPEEGRAPGGMLALADDGNIYGVTVLSVAGVNDGTLFRIVTADVENPDGGFETLHSFSAAVEGSAPRGVVRGSDGRLYGMTSSGGANGLGAIFAVDTGTVPEYPLIEAFSASPSELTWNGTVLNTTLSWSVINATGCEAQSEHADWMGAVSADGSKEVAIVSNGLQEFTLTCWNGEVRTANNSSSRLIRVNASEVPNPPQVALTVTPETIEVGQDITVAWDVNGATSCTAAGATGWSGSFSAEELAAVTGSRIISVAGSPGTRTLALTCDNQGIPAETVSVELTVTAAPIPPEDEIDATSGGGGALPPGLLLMLMLTGLARSAAWTPRRPA